MVEIYSPYVEVLWKRLPGSIRDISRAGFDGIECHLVGGLRSPKRIQQLKEEVRKYSLGIRFHQGWSWDTGQRCVQNMILRPLGALVSVGAPLAEQMIPAVGHPVVVYGNHAITSPFHSNYLYQTACEHVGGHEYRETFSPFVRRVLENKLPVVFDTQHVLEWCLNATTVEGLVSNRSVLLGQIETLWGALGPFVKEIHLCDFLPRLGASRGRNVNLGQGVFPLEEFCEIVRGSGWSGVVTPEVGPQHLPDVKSLRELRSQVQELFSS